MPELWRAQRYSICRGYYSNTGSWSSWGIMHSANFRAAPPLWCTYWHKESKHYDADADEMDCLLAAVDISLFGQEGHSWLNGSREMWYMCQNVLALVSGWFVKISWWLLCVLGVSVCSGCWISNILPKGTLAWSTVDTLRERMHLVLQPTWNTHNICTNRHMSHTQTHTNPSHTHTSTHYSNSHPGHTTCPIPTI